ncbi:transporter substrate-binding domain-containing protein, partial [Falsiroseomonas oryzae]|uniref:transporter substrate-binding domain-containing protein n=1 Tax=Falsiroseomonas oryzae TaxID=2766473 RepID=UPI0022EA719F
TGRLRVGIGVGPAASAFWALRQPDGSPRGVTVALAEEAARRLGVPLELVIYPSSGAVTDAGAAMPPGWDLAFMPVDAERAARVAFGPDYYLSVSTYLVPAGSTLQRVEDANREGVRIGGVAGTTTIRAAQRAHPRATFVASTGLDEVMQRLAAGELDAIALGRESLDSLLPRLPGARILDGHFHALGTAVAVPRGRPLAHAWATAFIESAKADGTVRRALDAMEIRGPVAPAGSRTAGA